MRTGTSYFVSRKRAIMYYKEYHYDNTEQAVDRKIADGEIHIGKPYIKKDQSIEIIDSGCRYCINERRI